MQFLRNRRRSNENRGFTLTESAIVLGIIGLVLSAVWIASARVIQGNKVTTATQEATTIALGLKALYGPRGHIDAYTTGAVEITSSLISFGLIPTNMPTQSVTDPNQGTAVRPIHPWGSYMSSYAMSPTTFRLSFYNLPTAACVGLESALASQTGSTAPIGVGSWYTAKSTQPGIPGQAYGADTYYNPIPTPFTPTTAAATCGGVSGDPAVSGAVSAEFDFTI